MSGDLNYSVIRGHFRGHQTGTISSQTATLGAGTLGFFSHQTTHSFILKTISNSFLFSFILKACSQPPFHLGFLYSYNVVVYIYKKKITLYSPVFPAGSGTPFGPMGFKQISVEKSSFPDKYGDESG